jgi:IS5 family transposase
VVFGDASYNSDEYKRGARHLGMRWCINDYPQGALETQTEKEPVVQAEKAQPQAIVGAGRVEHIFRIIKCQFGFRKTRYRGLAKNASQVNLLVGLANL